jgi:hypothetical protein
MPEDVSLQDLPAGYPMPWSILLVLFAALGSTALLMVWLRTFGKWPPSRSASASF